MKVNPLDYVLYVNCLEELDFKNLRQRLNSDSLLILRGLVKKNDIEKSIIKIKDYFKKENDNPTTGESPKDIQSNFQKLLVGGHTHSGLYLTRLFRTFYNPIWEEDIFKMHDIFKLMIRVRNLLANLPEDFALTKIESNGLWSATRIHQYPTGGGYFTKHKDTILTSVSKQNYISFYQVILNMTKCGINFDTGGAFIEVKGSKIIFEKEFEVGDIIIYDERTIHGVEEIDIKKNLNLDSICGRITAFVSLYKDMN